jgi:hypothetical protein
MPEIKDFPITGVMRCTQAVWEDAYNQGVDLSFDQFEKDYIDEHGCPPPDEVCECIEIDEPVFLLGDWEEQPDGNWDYKPRCEGKGFAAILGWLGGAPIVTVVWSETVRTVLSMCSPCCPGQADLDSGAGEILAYALPADYDWDGE